MDYYPLSDLLYRSVALTDENKDIVEAYDTDAYGNTLIFNDPGDDEAWFTDDDVPTDAPLCPFIFTGRRYDPETGIYYYRARYYHQELGRFLSRDPVGYADDMSLYIYVMGSPTTGVDPSGQHHLSISPVQLSPAQVPPGGGRTILDPNKLAIIGDYNEQTKCCILRGEAFIPTGVCSSLLTEQQVLDSLAEKWETAVPARDLYYKAAYRVFNDPLIGEAKDRRYPERGLATRARVLTREAALAHEDVHVAAKSQMVQAAFDQVHRSMGDDTGFKTTAEGCRSIAAAKTRDFRKALRGEIAKKMPAREQEVYNQHLGLEEIHAYNKTKQVLQGTASRIRETARRQRWDDPAL